MPNEKPIEKRDYSSINIGNFREALSNLNWSNVYSSLNAQEAFDFFWNDFEELHDLFFPLVKTNFNKRFHKINPWMTKGLLISRSQKLKLRKFSLILTC